MAIPKKGSRRIVVDGQPFRWLIRRKPTHTQWEGGFFEAAVQLAAVPASVLVIELGRTRPDVKWGEKPDISVTPQMIAECIRQAIENGWQPSLPGKQFVLDASKIAPPISPPTGR